jgi:hypothetical protein
LKYGPLHDRAYLDAPHMQAMIYMSTAEHYSGWEPAMHAMRHGAAARQHWVARRGREAGAFHLLYLLACARKASSTDLLSLHACMSCARQSDSKPHSRNGIQSCYSGDRNVHGLPVTRSTAELAGQALQCMEKTSGLFPARHAQFSSSCTVPDTRGLPAYLSPPITQCHAH